MGSSHDRETLEPGDIQKNEGSVHTNTRSAVSTYTACGIQHMANIILLPPLTFGFLVITWLDVFGLHSPPILAKSPRTRVFDLAYNVPTSSPQDSQLTGRESHVFILSTCHHHHHVSLFFISVFSNHVRYPSVFFFFFSSGGCIEFKIFFFCLIPRLRTYYLEREGEGVRERDVNSHSSITIQIQIQLKMQIHHPYPVPYLPLSK